MKRLKAGGCAPEEQRVDIVGAFIGGHGFKASANAE